jgi:hypothetical protein
MKFKFGLPYKIIERDSEIIMGQHKVGKRWKGLNTHICIY